MGQFDRRSFLKECPGRAPRPVANSISFPLLASSSASHLSKLFFFFLLFFLHLLLLPIWPSCSVVVLTGGTLSYFPHFHLWCVCVVIYPALCAPPLRIPGTRLLYIFLKALFIIPLSLYIHRNNVLIPRQQKQHSKWKKVSVSWTTGKYIFFLSSYQQLFFTVESLA